MLDYSVDFYCHEIGLAIEIDGNSHNNNYFYDAKRQGRLEKEGVVFIRFSVKDISHETASVLISLQTKIEELLSE